MKNLFPGALAILSVAGFVGFLGVDVAAPVAAAPKAYTAAAPLDVIIEVRDSMFSDLAGLVNAGKMKFKKIRRQALFLAEVSNIISHADSKEWQAYEQKTRAELLNLAKATKAKNAKEVKSLWSKVHEGAKGKPSAKANRGKGTPSYKLVAPLDAIMYITEDLFYAIEEQVEGKEFDKITKHAYLLAEVSNIVRFANEEGGDAWKGYADRAATDFVALAKASAAKDAKQVKSLFAKVETSCDSCHEKFRD